MRFVLVLLFSASVSAVAQPPLDSLYDLLPIQKEDTVKANILNNIAFLNLAHSLDSMQVYAQRAITLSEQN